jgi:hypothetical protein
MRPATREGAFDLVAEIIDRGLRRRQRKAVDATKAGPNNRLSSKSDSPSDASAA